MTGEAKKCEVEGCKELATSGYRHCRKCRAAIRKKMSDEGYYRPLKTDYYRSSEQKENQRETKGEDSPWQQIAIKTLEEQGGGNV